MVGSVFALLSRYAVNLWNQGLHQGATLTVRETSPIDASYYYPLLVCITGFVLLFLTLVLLRTRMHIRLRRVKALLARDAT
jgi:heme exporter protein C